MDPTKLDISKLFLGANIVIIGIYILLGNIGTVSFGYLPYLVKFWPLVIIAVGLDLLLKPYNLGYIGSILFIVFLIIAIVASVPGQSGSGVRKLLSIPEEPSENWFTDIWQSFRGHGGVVETQKYTEEIALKPNKIVFNLKHSKIDWMSVIVKSSDKVAINYEMGLKSRVKNEQYKLDIKTEQLGDESVININPASQLEKGVFYNVKIELSAPPETMFVIRGNTGHFELQDNWKGELDFYELRDADLITKDIDGIITFGTLSGNVKVGNVKEAKINTASGEIHIQGSQGNVNLQTISGSIWVGSMGSGEVKSTSGDITVASCKGDLKASTVSGDAHFESCFGSVNIGTTSGDVTVKNLLVTGGESNIKSISGDINISVDKNSSVTCTFSTLSGDVRINGFKELSNIELEHKKGFIVGDGKSIMTISTTSGDIKVMEK